MFGQIGIPEMMLILVIALLVFGPSKLPQVGRSLGEGITSFKKALNEVRNEEDKDSKSK